MVPDALQQLEKGKKGVGLGWLASWSDSILAVVLISALIGLLVGAVQVSRQMQ